MRSRSSCCWNHVLTIASAVTLLSGAGESAGQSARPQLTQVDLELIADVVQLDRSQSGAVPEDDGKIVLLARQTLSEKRLWVTERAEAAEFRRLIPELLRRNRAPAVLSEFEARTPLRLVDAKDIPGPDGPFRSRPSLWPRDVSYGVYVSLPAYSPDAMRAVIMVEAVGRGGRSWQLYFLHRESGFWKNARPPAGHST
jgi:hypothetical protein